MTKTAEKLASEIHSLPDIEKLRLVDAILTDLDKPDPEIDRLWAEEARKRWAAYKAGRIPVISYQEIMDKYRQS
jgi:putative addiction module component (TIGR02574 family)